MDDLRIRVNHWPEGDVIHFTAAFTRVSDGTPADPSTLTFYYQIDDGQVVEMAYFPGGGPGEIERDDVGLYHLDLDSTGLPGHWLYRWKGLGSAQASGWRRMVIEAAPIP